MLGLESIRQKCRDQGTLDLELERNGTRIKAHLVLKGML